jgi:hypothetical protein
LIPGDEVADLAEVIGDVESFVTTHASGWLQLPNTDVGELTRLVSFPNGVVALDVADCSRACDAEATCTSWVAMSDPQQLFEGANCWLGSGWAGLRVGVAGRVFEDRTAAAMEAEVVRKRQDAARLRTQASEARAQAAVEKLLGKEAAKAASDLELARAGLARAGALLQAADDLDNRARRADEDGFRASQLASRVAVALVAARQLEGTVLLTEETLLKNRDWCIDHERLDEAASFQAEAQRVRTAGQSLTGLAFVRLDRLLSMLRTWAAETVTLDMVTLEATATGKRSCFSA